MKLIFYFYAVPKWRVNSTTSAKDMELFKSSKSNRIKQSLLGGLYTVVIFLLVLLVYKIIYGKLPNSIGFAISVVVILKLREIIVPYYIREIKLDKKENRIEFILKSRMLGTESRKYDLEKTQAKLTQYSRFRRLFAGPGRLEIFITTKDYFILNCRTGFDFASLEKLKDKINLA